MSPTPAPRSATGARRFPRCALPIALLAAGCLSSRPAVEPRFYQLPALEIPAVSPAPATARSWPVRLERVDAAPHLRERLTWRVSDVELAFDDRNRWAAPPEELVRPVLLQTFLTSGRLRVAGSRDLPALHVTVTRFEGELPAEQAWVELLLTLQHAHTGLLESARFVAVRPLGEPDSASLARALGAALEEAAGEAVGWVHTRLARLAPEPPAQGD